MDPTILQPGAGEAIAAAPDDSGLVAALRGGDEAAFVALVERYHGAMLRVAGLYVADRAVAEEVVQETWLAALEGLDGFAGRSSLKTWLFRILTNRAKTRGQRERRSVPFSAFEFVEIGAGEPAVDPARFRPPDAPAWPGHWAVPPRQWGDAPEERLLAAEAHEHVERAIAALPPNQRAVITLRDVQGWDAAEICTLLGVTEANQRVLLHRARAKVRQALAGYLAGD